MGIDCEGGSDWTPGLCEAAAVELGRDWPEPSARAVAKSVSGVEEQINQMIVISRCTPEITYYIERVRVGVGCFRGLEFIDVSIDMNQQIVAIWEELPTKIPVASPLRPS